MTGKFITIEGTDGAGKSTQIAMLVEFLKNKGIECVVTREPGGTKIGEKLRERVLDPENGEMTYVTEAMLYAASRAQHVEEKIIPALTVFRPDMMGTAEPGFYRSSYEKDSYFLFVFPVSGVLPLDGKHMPRTKRVRQSGNHYW